MKKEKGFSLMVAMMILFIQFLGAPSFAQEFCGDWRWVTGLQSGETMRDALYAEGKYWAVGDSGTIMSSEDGQTWQRKQRVTTAALLDITSNGEFFIAYGEFPSVILKSYDGEEWTAYENCSLFGCQKIEWANDKFIAIQASYPDMIILASTDGVSWEESFRLTFDDGVDPYMRGILVTPGEIIAYGYTETYDQSVWHTKSYFLSSQDGSDWAVKSTIDDFVVSSISFNGADYIVTGGNKIFRSADLIDFDVDFEYGPDSQSCFIASFWDGHNFYSLSGPNTPNFISYYPYSEYDIYKDSGKQSWTKFSEVLAPAINSMTYSTGKITAAGGLGYLAVSSDGNEWREQRPFTYSEFYDATYFKGKFLAAGTDWDTGNPSVWSSPDAVSWQESYREDDYLDIVKMASDKDLCVLIGGNGSSTKIFSTTDGENYELMYQSEYTAELKDVAIGRNHNVVVVGSMGDNGVIFSGSRRQGITQHTFPDLADIYSVATNGKLFVALGRTEDDGLILLKSENGTSWKTKHLKKNYNYYAFFPFVRFGGGKFLVGALDEYDNPCFLTSPDGSSWKLRTFDYLLYLTKFHDLEWCGNFFFGVIDYNSEWGSAGYAISKDGLNWTLDEKETQWTIRGVAHHGSQFLQVGSASSLMLADCPKR